MECLTDTASRPIPSKPGIYTLIVNLATALSLPVGGLGVIELPRGLYTYTGSARGRTSTNLRNRLHRHLRAKNKQHWHIDYLLQARPSTIVAVIYIVTSVDIECIIANAILGRENFTASVRGFGASDCRNRCPSHLSRYVQQDRDQLLKDLTATYREFGSPHLIVLDGHASVDK